MAGARFPISKGFSISFSADGRAHSHGKPGAEALDAVEEWLLTHAMHEKREFVEQWIKREREQIEADKNLQTARVKRAKIITGVDEVVRKSGLPKPLQKVVGDVARSEALKARGIPEKEE
jgi:hypothetical protein